MREPRNDPAFRQQFLAQNLDRLLEALKRMRRASSQNADTARQIREGADLAVKLADRLQSGDPGPARRLSERSVIRVRSQSFVLPCLFAKTPYKPRAPSILVGS